MKLETFFEKFDQLADAHGAVGKMRGLVLNLAVQGKLIDQIPSDEPANKLIERIRETKERLSSKRTIRRQDTDPIGEDEAPFSIPESWVWTRLGEIGDWGSGSTPARGSHDLYDGGIAWLKSGELNDNQALAGSAETVTELALKTGSFRRNQPGDVLFAMYGATIGKVAILAEPAVTNQAVCGCTPFEGVSNRYLFNYLVSQRAAFHEASEGGAQPNLSKVKIVAFPFPLPPLAEQKRIVAKVDELMALCDRLEAQQQERKTRHAALARASLVRFADAPTCANLSLLFHPSYDITPADLRKSILTLAVQGKLVPQDPNDEPALALLARIAAHKTALASEGQLRGSTNVQPLAHDEGEFELPPNWTWVRFGEIMINRDGERIPVSKEERETKAKTYDYYGASGVIDKIDGYLFDKPLLLIGEDGANLINRSTPIAFIARGKYWVNNHAHVLDGISEDFLQFIELHINAINLEQYVTGSAQPKMNQAKMNSIPIALPPLAEQRRIVAKVDQLMSLVDQLEAQLAAAKTASAAVLEAAIDELLNPTAQIIPFPSAQRDLQPDRAAIGCYAIQRLGNKRTFGRTAEVKVLYLAETHLGLELGGQYLRDAAGPFDHWIYQFEDEAKRQQWFSVKESSTKKGNKIEYRTGPNLAAKAAKASTHLPAAARSELDRLLTLLANRPTVEVEIIATLFAAWNDFLIDGRSPTDAEIAHDVRENWHPSKKRFSEAALNTWLAWLRAHSLVPKGRGPHTVGQQAKLGLH